MNCANHGERTATAFCQNCGKSLCPECTRTADGLILCEPCLVGRGGAAHPGSSYFGPEVSSAPGTAWTGVPPTSPKPAAGWQPVSPTSQGYRPAPGIPLAQAPSHASPVLAALLATIPGVGAMYNGQFIKALLHVVIFIVLIGVTEHLPLVGILIGAWFFYQIFDAAQTAAARRDGRPLPDPFGILDMSHRLGSNPPASPAYTSSAIPPQPGIPGQSPVSSASTAAYVPVQPAPAMPAPRRGEPIGAIVLIVVGLLFLLSTLGVLDVDWLGRGWPLLLVVAGAWLLIRRVRAPEPMMPAAGWAPFVPGAPVPTPEPSRATSLSSAPQDSRPTREEEEQ